MRGISVRKLMIIIAVLAAVFGLLDQMREETITAYDVAVGVKSTSGPIQSVFCQATAEKRDADEIAEAWMNSKPLDPGRWATEASPFTGAELSIPLNSKHLKTMLGRVLTDFRLRHLFVGVRYADGARGFKIVDLPPEGLGLSVRVVFP